jgi:hypothetical protein
MNWVYELADDNRQTFATCPRLSKRLWRVCSIRCSDPFQGDLKALEKLPSMLLKRWVLL